jgi:hypothetical protein
MPSTECYFDNLTFDIFAFGNFLFEKSNSDIATSQFSAYQPFWQLLGELVEIARVEDLRLVLRRNEAAVEAAFEDVLLETIFGNQFRSRFLNKFSRCYILLKIIG